MRLHLKYMPWIGLALFGVRLADAGVIFNLTPPVLSTVPGRTIEFTGTLINTGTTDVFLNGDLSVLQYQELVLDDSPFFDNAPLFLTPGGGSYTGPFFDVIVSPSALAASYSGSFTIQGGGDSNAFDDLATQNFQVTVTGSSSVPEPSTFWLLACAISLIGGCAGLRTFGSRRKT